MAICQPITFVEQANQISILLVAELSLFAQFYAKKELLTNDIELLVVLDDFKDVELLLELISLRETRRSSFIGCNDSSVDESLPLGLDCSFDLV